MTAVEVQHGSRTVRVSTETFNSGRPINVLVVEGGHSMGGLSMSRENAETVRDALTAALEETKPKPSKAERIKDALREDLSMSHREARLKRKIRDILAEDGPL